MILKGIPKEENSIKETTYRIFTGGAVNSKKKLYGWGIVVFRSKTDVYSESGTYPIKEEHASTDLDAIAEFLAVIQALDYVIKDKPRRVVLCNNSGNALIRIFAEKPASNSMSFHKHKEYIEKWADLERLGIDVFLKNTTENDMATALAESAIKKELVMEAKRKLENERNIPTNLL